MSVRSEKLSYHQDRVTRTKAKAGLRIQSEDADLLQDPIVEVFMAAAITFQDVHRGKAWLLSPNQAFNQQPPVTAINNIEVAKRY